VIVKIKKQNGGCYGKNKWFNNGLRNSFINIIMLSHIKNGNAYMVNVIKKKITTRIAIAKAEIIFPREIFNKIMIGNKKGDIISTSKIAGINGCKKTSELIPLCHPINVSHIDIKYRIDEKKSLIEIQSSVIAEYNTGVEMEALTAVSISALTLYDMTKALSHNIRINNICLMYKNGGKTTYINNDYL